MEGRFSTARFVPVKADDVSAPAVELQQRKPKLRSHAVIFAMSCGATPKLRAVTAAGVSQ